MTLPGPRRPPGFLLACFGLCLPESYAALPAQEPRAEPTKPAKPKRPTTNWREIPLFAKYELLKQIGKGGFSEIWLCENRSSKEMVAIKVVQLANEDFEPEEVATLLAEAKYLRTLDCPYLLRCYETAATEDWLVLVLEYLSGGELLDHIHKVKKYTEAEAARLFAQVVSAVSYLHNLDLMHRDIKPENIMFTAPVEVCEAEGRPLRVKVIDLGMAALYDSSKEIKGCIGTPGFVAPELWNDGPHTPACDIYSLGAVLFIMLTGRKPHSGVDIRMMTYCNKSIREAAGLKDERFLSLSPAARSLLVAMLADDPRDRPTAGQVLRHDFITAVDASAEAQREMGDVVRRRMRDLAQLRRVHGLRFALRLHKPAGADHEAFLQVLDQRRLKLKGQAGSFGRTSEAHPFARASQTPSDGVPSFARTSLHASYAALPPPPAAAGASAPPQLPPAAAAAADGGGSRRGRGGEASSGAIAMTPPHIPSPFARVSGGPSGDAASRLTLGASRFVVPPVPSPRHPPNGGGGGGAAGAAAPSPPPDGIAGSPSLPDDDSRDLGLPVPAGLAARPPPPLPPLPPLALPPLTRVPHGYGATAAAAGGGGPHGIDPMMLVNALPSLQHCPSMPVVDAAPGVGLGLGLGPDGERMDGGSPVAAAGVLEAALLSKCMSANPYTLELLAHQETLTRVLERGY